MESMQYNFEQTEEQKRQQVERDKRLNDAAEGAFYANFPVTFEMQQEENKDKQAAREQKAIEEAVKEKASDLQAPGEQELTDYAYDLLDRANQGISSGELERKRNEQFRIAKEQAEYIKARDIVNKYETQVRQAESMEALINGDSQSVASGLEKNVGQESENTSSTEILLGDPDDNSGEVNLGQPDDNSGKIDLGEPDGAEVVSVFSTDYIDNGVKWKNTPRKGWDLVHKWEAPEGEAEKESRWSRIKKSIGSTAVVKSLFGALGYQRIEDLGSSDSATKSAGIDLGEPEAQNEIDLGEPGTEPDAKEAGEGNSEEGSSENEVKETEVSEKTSQQQEYTAKDISDLTQEEISDREKEFVGYGYIYELANRLHNDNFEGTALTKGKCKQIFKSQVEELFNNYSSLRPKDKNKILAYCRELYAHAGESSPRP